MANHPNRNWRRRWKFSDGVFLHEPTGLRVRFERAADDPSAWDGEPTNGDTVSAALIAEHGPVAAGKQLARLMREAGDLFLEREEKK